MIDHSGDQHGAVRSFVPQTTCAKRQVITFTFASACDLKVRRVNALHSTIIPIWVVRLRDSGFFALSGNI